MKSLPLVMLVAAVVAPLAARAAAVDDGWAEPAQPPAPAARIVVDDADENADLQPFVPDVYPSRPDAAGALGRSWAAQAAQRWKHKPARVRIMSDDQSLIAPISQAVRGVLRGVAVEPCDGTLCRSTNAPAGEAWLYVESSAREGTLLAHSTGASDAAVTASFVEKPWAADFGRFCAQTPGRWRVGHSDAERPAGSASEAGREARGNAAHDVVPLVLARLGRDGRRNEGEVFRFVEAQLAGDRLVTDHFRQTYERPYGSLYRESVLIDASDAQLDSLADDLRGTLASQRESRVKGFASAVGVLLLTYALYRFANAFTRGYFTWSLRTAAAVLAAGAVMLIVAVA
jgi:hypothetical protein